MGISACGIWTGEGGGLSRSHRKIVPLEDPDLDRRELVAHRTGLVFLVVLVAVALLGGFGRGFLAQRSVTSGPITATYEGVLRQGLSSRIDVSSASAFSTVVIDRGILDRFSDIKFLPEPSESRLRGDGLHLEFDPTTDDLQIDLVPMRPGASGGSIAVDGIAVALSMLTLP
jgi:hypothetical protein